MSEKKMNRREWIGNAVAISATAVAGSSFFALKRKENRLYVPATVNGELKKLNCIDCQHCMPCDFGVNIPGVFLFVNSAIDKDSVPKKGNDGKIAVSEIKAFISRYDFTLNDKEQAHRCITCYHCAGHCPQNIFIAREMVRIGDIIEEYRDIIAEND